MRINFAKFQSAEDRLHGLNATREKQQERVNDLRRDLLNHDQAVRRGLQFGVSPAALHEIGVPRRDPAGFMAALASDPARVLVALDNHNDGLESIVRAYVETSLALAKAEKSLSLTELDHRALSTTVHRMRDFIRTFTNAESAIPRMIP